MTKKMKKKIHFRRAKRDDVTDFEADLSLPFYPRKHNGNVQKNSTEGLWKCFTNRPENKKYR